MGRKCKCPPAGAPEWMVTYGDMVTLLLCFFVLIVSFSEIKKEDQFQAVVEEIKKAFGMRGGGGKMPTDDDPALSMIEILEAMRMRNERIPNKSNVKDPGQSGREPRVTTIREGKRYAVGGKILFEPESAELSAQAQQQLVNLVSQLKLKDSKNIIELNGHASAMELVQSEGDQTIERMDLSHDRAVAVMRFLISDEIPEQHRLESNRFRAIGSSDHEPIVISQYSANEARDNRRVEIVVTEHVVEDKQGRGEPSDE